MEKKTKPLTEKRLMNIALYYLERYESSAGHLYDVLKNRAFKEKSKGAELAENIDDIIQGIVQKAQDLGYVDDHRFAKNTVKNQKAMGKSNKYIKQKLVQAKIDSEIIKNVLDEFEEQNQESELVAACKYVRKKRLGHYRGPEKQQLFKQKDLGSLARAGFSFEVAVQALKQNKQDEEYNDEA